MSNFPSCWFLVSDKLAAWLFNILLIPENQTKNIKVCDGGIPKDVNIYVPYANISCSVPVFD